MQLFVFLSHFAACLFVLQGAICPRFYPQPVSAPGYFPRSSQEFVQCVPVAACPGVDVTRLSNSTLTLSPYYAGDSLILLSNDSLLSSTVFTNWTHVNELLNMSFAMCAPGKAWCQWLMRIASPNVLCIVIGYTEASCSKCIPGYYRLDQDCLICPKGAYSLIIVTAFILGE